MQEALTAKKSLWSSSYSLFLFFVILHPKRPLSDYLKYLHASQYKVLDITSGVFLIQKTNMIKHDFLFFFVIDVWGQILSNLIYIYEYYYFLVQLINEHDHFRMIILAITSNIHIDIFNFWTQNDYHLQNKWHRYLYVGYHEIRLR